MCIPWGDVSTAFSTTGIPNIETFTMASPKTFKALKWQWLYNWILRMTFIKNMAKKKKLRKKKKSRRRDNNNKECKKDKQRRRKNFFDVTFFFVVYIFSNDAFFFLGQKLPNVPFHGDGIERGNLI